MKRLLIIPLLFFCFGTFAQKVKITKMSNSYFHHEKVEGFYCLHDSAETSYYQWIANVKIEFDTIKPNTLSAIYHKIESKANKIGGNAFRVIDSDIYTYGNKKYLEIGLFHLRFEHRDQNLALFQGPNIYMFGFLGHHQRIEGYKIEVNGVKMILKELRYKFYAPSTGDVIYLKLGNGFKSDKHKVKIEKGMLPRYYKFNIYKGMLSRGLISEHEWSYGEFLVRILKSEKERL